VRGGALQAVREIGREIRYNFFIAFLLKLLYHASNRPATNNLWVWGQKGDLLLQMPPFFRNFILKNLKEPLTIEQQIKRLQEHNVIVENESDAKEFLRQNNYYRLTGYALQFRKLRNDSNLSFSIKIDQLIGIYTFDEELRALLRSYLEVIEIYFRTLIANTFSLAHCTQAPFDQHYDENNYKNIDGFNKIKEHFKKEREYYSDSLIIRHHQLSYEDKLPLWAIVELLSFSDLSKYYACLKDADADKIAKACGTSSKELANHLRCLSILRNKCSHAARLYNIELNPPAMLPAKLLKMLAKNNGNSTLFAYLYVLCKRLPSRIRRESYKKSTEELIEKYKKYIDLELLGFPQDWENHL